MIACVRHVIHERPEGESIRTGLEAAVEVLEFVNANAEVIRAAYRLLKHPVVKAFFAAFPNSEFLELPNVVSKDLRGAKTRGTEGSEDRSRVRGFTGEVSDH